MAKHYFTVTGLKRVREQFERELKRAMLLALDEAAGELETDAHKPSLVELTTDTADAVEEWLQKNV